jgi:hypothetical protein
MTDSAAATPTADFPPLTLADFEAAGLEALLADHVDADCHALQPLLWAAKDAHAEAASRALALLGNVCTMMLTPEEATVVFRPRVVWSDGTGSMTPDHLTASDVEALAQVVDKLAPPALRARVADLVWLRERKRGVRFPRVAIEAYRSRPITFDTWHHGEGACWHRALQLAKQIRAGDEVEKIEHAILDAFFGTASSEGYEPLHFVKPLLAEKRAGGRVRDVAEQLESIARRHFDKAHAFLAESYFGAAAEWYQWARDEERQDTMLAMAARSIALQADQGDGAIVQHTWLTKAIDAYRRVPARSRRRLDVDAAIDALRRQREAAGHAMLGEMVSIKGPSVDISDIVKASIDHVIGRIPLDALLAFCGLDSPPDAAALKAEAEASLRAHPLSTLIDSAVMADDGRQVANTGPQAGWEGQVAEKARALFRTNAGFVAVSSLAPALDHIRNEHAYRLADFVAIAERSPVVLADRASIVGKGLHAGFCGDMVQAMHILMPQFEHMVRQVLRAGGAFTAEHRPDGLDMEIALASLVGRQEMVDEFGDGLTLAIHAIMCDRAGSNLRNDVAHGLADDDLCASPFALYAWWMVLQLVVETFAAAQEAATTAIAPEPLAEVPPHFEKHG